MGRQQTVTLNQGKLRVRWVVIGDVHAENERLENVLRAGVLLGAPPRPHRVGQSFCRCCRREHGVAQCVALSEHSR